MWTGKIQDAVNYMKKNLYLLKFNTVKPKLRMQRMLAIRICASIYAVQVCICSLHIAQSAHKYLRNLKFSIWQWDIETSVAFEQRIAWQKVRRAFTLFCCDLFCHRIYLRWHTTFWPATSGILVTPFRSTHSFCADLIVQEAFRFSCRWKLT